MAKAKHYRNIGGPWRRSNGELVPRDGIFAPDAVELGRMERRRQVGTRFVPAIAPEEVAGYRGQNPAPAPTAPQGVTASDGPESEEEMEQAASEDVEDGAGDEEDGEAGDGAAEAAAAGWPLRMTPDRYLRLHPDGQYAEMARGLIRQKA